MAGSLFQSDSDGRDSDFENRQQSNDSENDLIHYYGFHFSIYSNKITCN